MRVDFLLGVAVKLGHMIYPQKDFKNFYFRRFEHRLTAVLKVGYYRVKYFEFGTTVFLYGFPSCAWASSAKMISCYF